MLSKFVSYPVQSYIACADCYSNTKETESEIVITSHELLPKFRTILKERTDKVKTIVYIENPIKRTDLTGYRSGVFQH